MAATTLSERVETYWDFLREIEDAGFDRIYLEKILPKYAGVPLGDAVDIEILKRLADTFMDHYDSIVMDNGTGDYNPDDIYHAYDLMEFYRDFEAFEYADEEMDAHDHKISIKDALYLGIHSFYENSVYALGWIINEYLDEVLGKE